jgi:hypothetical protein
MIRVCIRVIRVCIRVIRVCGVIPVHTKRTQFYKWRRASYLLPSRAVATLQESTFVMRISRRQPKDIVVIQTETWKCWCCSAPSAQHIEKKMKKKIKNLEPKYARQKNTKTKNIWIACFRRFSLAKTRIYIYEKRRAHAGRDRCQGSRLPFPRSRTAPAQNHAPRHATPRLKDDR